MKQTLKKIIGLMTCICTISSYAEDQMVAPLYSIRSQGVDAARELAGWTSHVNLFDMDKAYGSFSLTAEYSRSFRPQDINRSLFNNCGECYTVAVSGSQTNSRGVNDWLADYFYLPTDFRSVLKFKPRIENAIVDLNFYLGLDEWVSGLFFRLHLPIVYTKWNLDFCETTSTTGTNAYEAGYFAPSTIARTDLLENFSSFAAGRTPNGVLGTTLNPLQYAKFDGCSHSQTRLAELQAVLGYNFINDEDYHLGIGLRFSAPTGNAPQGRLLFEPIAGNGRHWELGAHVTSHAMLWRSCNEESSLGFYLDANITHLFNATQTRTFDLKDKPLSRYMLAEKIAAPITTLSGGATSAGSIVPSAQFKNEFTPVANLSTFKVNVKANIQVDLAAQLTFAVGGFNWDLGYDFWYRSCEKISKRCNNCPSVFAANTWALKGDSYVVGFVENSTTPINISATESTATIHAGNNFASTGIGTDGGALATGRRNPNIDNAQLAWMGVGGTALVSQPSLAATSQTRTSVEPVFITECDFNRVGVKGISNKVYTHFSYQWVDHEDWVPYIGVGAFAEFGKPYGGNGRCPSVSSSCDSSCAGSTHATGCCGSSCITTSLSQWGMWVKSGVSFN